MAAPRDGMKQRNDAVRQWTYHVNTNIHDLVHKNNQIYYL